MRKSNGSNGVPAWVKMDLRVLKRVSVSLVEMQRENQRRMAKNERILVEMVRRNDRLEVEMAANRKTMDERTASLKDEAAANRKTMDERTASLKKVSDIHTKAIMRILDKI